MKKLLFWLLIAAMACSLGGVQVLAAEPDEIVGSYVLTDMDDGSGTDSSAMLAAMQALGMNATLEIREDGAATMYLFIQSMDLVFDFETKQVFSGEKGVPYTYTDGVLTFGNDEASFTFTKTEAVSAPSAGPFDYYLLYLVKENGTETAYEKDDVALFVFGDGSGTLAEGEERVALKFDFEAMTVGPKDDDGSSAVAFTLEDGVLTLTKGERSLYFRQADPGHVGTYEMTGLRTEADGDLTEMLASLSALGEAPTLTIDEDGKGVISMFGDTMEICFDFETMTASAVDGNGEPEIFPFTYENGTLRLEEDGEYMIFRRVMSAAGAAEEAPAEDAAAEPAA
ncbi:MAG: hypothetical protein IKQ10_05870 [Oscillospiraceae bacterium]|nr:hypothetical protein [Oscillospiraceae bacterium]